ncbi:hypothetical protein AAFC00_000280 [Neodothiora populina]|uniref:HIT-type domain-containing protein n=1 Tax=Neodothiora populina TaxID=2781224 RepID=A0ABR3PDN1_9PEZI
MADRDAPLTSLCSICYTNPPKYVCPRDHVKTCSLPCYKRHQQRASCNGKRDPTAYVRKEKLTTASGIDHDYNFLSGVESVFDKADRDREERGIDQSDQNHRRRWHFDGPLQKYLRHNQIQIDHAPLGLSRQKANQTRYIQKSKRIVWTVEWIDADGAKRLSEVHEAATIGEAYTAMLADKERGSKKRKRAGSVEASPSKTPRQGPVAAAEEMAKEDNPRTSTSAPDTLTGDDTVIDEAAGVRTLVESEEPQEAEEDKRSLILSRIESEASRQATLRAAKSPTGPPFFYLLRPHTSATSRVLIPLLPDQTLTASLELRTVLEYPTVYVLDQGQEELSERYMTEAAYTQKLQEDDKEVEELLKAVPDATAAGRIGTYGGKTVTTAEGSSSGATNDLDPSKILEMLRRDVPT